MKTKFELEKLKTERDAELANSIMRLIDDMKHQGRDQLLQGLAATNPRVAEGVQPSSIVTDGSSRLGYVFSGIGTSVASLLMDDEMKKNPIETLIGLINNLSTGPYDQLMSHLESKYPWMQHPFYSHENREISSTTHHVIRNLKFNIAELSMDFPGHRGRKAYALHVVVGDEQQHRIILGDDTIKRIINNINDIDELKNIFTNTIGGLPIETIISLTNLIETERDVSSKPGAR